MHLDTEKTIYLAVDSQNGQVTLLTPKEFPFEIIELRVSDPNPDSTDAAEFKLLESEMIDYRFDT